MLYICSFISLILNYNVFFFFLYLPWSFHDGHASIWSFLNSLTFVHYLVSNYFLFLNEMINGHLILLLSIVFALAALVSCLQACRSKERSGHLLRSLAVVLQRCRRNGCQVMCDSIWSWSSSSLQTPRSAMGAAHGMACMFVRGRSNVVLFVGKGFLPQ